MNLLHSIRQMKKNSLYFEKDIQEYVCMTQRTFSVCLFLFYAMHILIINTLDYRNCMILNAAIWTSVLQMLLALLWYFLFKHYFSRHQMHTLTGAFLNIFQVTLILEIQYFFFDEYTSYTVMICILLATSLTVIGHIMKYLSIITLVSLMDITATIYKHSSLVHSLLMKRYIIDCLFVIMIALGINFCFTQIKYKEFEQQREVSYLSERDSLTGLFNRKALEDFVQRYENHAATCALMLLDLDNFKTLNDTLGHYEGDQCLCRVANVLTALFEKHGCVCRLGGDEFVIFLPDIPDRDSVVKLGQTLLEKIPQEYTYKSGRFSVTCSVGIAFSPSGNFSSYEALYKAADSAMYASKAKGKNSLSISDG